MEKTHIRQRMICSALAGLVMIPGSAFKASAAEQTEKQPFIQAEGIESVLEKCYETEVKDNINLYLVPTEEGEYLNMAFSDTEDYTYIRSAPDEIRYWNIWTVGRRSDQVRRKAMFLLNRLLQEQRRRNRLPSMKIIQSQSPHML